MSEKKSYSESNELIVRYLSGEATDAEMHELELWVQADGEHKAQFIASKKSWMLAGLAQNADKIDLDKEWQKAAKQLSSDGKVVALPRRTAGNSRRQWLSIAAGFALLAVASFWLFKGFGNSVQAYAAEAEVLEQELPDGSEVTLNQFASLEFEATAEGNTRQVALEGDAFFDVKRDESRPFKINTQHVQIEVLGTSFYVDARAEQALVQVIVRSGAVAVQSGEDKVILAAGEVAVYDKATRQLSKRSNEDANYLSWKTKLFNFENNSLKAVVASLNASYNANIILENEQLGNCSLTATYADKSLDAVIRIIESTLGISSERNGQQIMLKGSCE